MVTLGLIEEMEMLLAGYERCYQSHVGGTTRTLFLSCLEMCTSNSPAESLEMGFFRARATLHEPHNAVDSLRRRIISTIMWAPSWIHFREVRSQRWLVGSSDRVMYIAGVRMWAKAPEGFPARSTVRANELRSRKEGACDADARPTRKEKAPVAYE